MSELAAFEEILQYSFCNRKLLQQALTHKSYVNENRHLEDEGDTLQDNERLEFLGDAVLELKVSKLLYAQFPDKPEGELSRARSQIVNAQALARYARSLGLGRYLRLGRGEEVQGGRQRVSLLADAFEALLAALYLDGAEACLQQLVAELVRREMASTQVDYKTQLQERLQEKNGRPPVYALVSRRGADHKPLFFVQVQDGLGNVIGAGSGFSLKNAEQKAAADALEVEIAAETAVGKKSG
ncbi:MAG: ribonuclease III [Deltaproteobacteria bacterium]|nr:ribonuclease III [Deltaproteobacteria bacterium]